MNDQEYSVWLEDVVTDRKDALRLYEEQLAFAEKQAVYWAKSAQTWRDSVATQWLAVTEAESRLAEYKAANDDRAE